MLTEIQLQLLRQLKETSGYTNKQIAEKVGTTESTVSRIYSGDSKDPSFDILSHIIITTGGSVDKILGLSTKIEGDEDMSSFIEALTKAHKKQCQTYEIAIAAKDQSIQNERKDKYSLFAVVAILIIFILGLFAYDFTHFDRGWFQQPQVDEIEQIVREIIEEEKL